MNHFVGITLLALSLSVTASDKAGEAATHCQSDEITYFSCKIQHSSKVASLCGGSFKDAQSFERREDAWLQYTFGRIRSKLELSYPPRRVDSLSRFAAEYKHPYQAFIHSLTFSNRGAMYELAIHGFENGESYYGLYVRKDEKTTALPCDGEPTTEFAPGGNDFFSLVTYIYIERK